MEIWSRSRGVVEYCPKKEYLQQVIDQFRALRRISELRRDRMFDRVVATLRDSVKLVDGDERRVTFRFSLTDGRHHRGSKYTLSWKGNLFKDVEPRKLRDEYGFEYMECHPEPHVEIAGLADLTPDALLEGIQLLEVQAVLDM